MTIYEILQQIGAQQQGEFGSSKVSIGKAGAESKAKLVEAQIALEEGLDKRKEEIEKHGERFSRWRFGAKAIDTLLGAPVLQTIVNTVGRKASKTRSLLGKKFDDPYRSFKGMVPDTPFYSSQQKKLKSSEKTISDFVGRAEEGFDRAMIPNLITDMITSYQTQAAGFTPDYIKGIFKGVGEGKGLFEVIKDAEGARRAGLIYDAKDKALGGKFDSSIIGKPQYDPMTGDKLFKYYDPMTGNPSLKPGQGYDPLTGLVKFKKG